MTAVPRPFNNELAERGGFEPPVQVYPVQQISNLSCSATPAPLREWDVRWARAWPGRRVEYHEGLAMGRRSSRRTAARSSPASTAVIPEAPAEKRHSTKTAAAVVVCTALAAKLVVLVRSSTIILSCSRPATSIRPPTSTWAGASRPAT